MFSMTTRSIVASILTVAFTAHHVSAVCAPGEVAVGTEFTWDINFAANQDIPFYSGFLMNNDCSIMSQNGVTQNKNQMCAGDYYGGASTNCWEGDVLVGIHDIHGTSYTCNPSTDTSCNLDYGALAGSFEVQYCCYVN